MNTVYNMLDGDKWYGKSKVEKWDRECQAEIEVESLSSG